MHATLSESIMPRSKPISLAMDISDDSARIWLDEEEEMMAAKVGGEDGEGGREQGKDEDEKMVTATLFQSDPDVMLVSTPVDKKDKGRRERMGVKQITKAKKKIMAGGGKKAGGGNKGKGKGGKGGKGKGKPSSSQKKKKGGSNNKKSSKTKKKPNTKSKTNKAKSKSSKSGGKKKKTTSNKKKTTGKK